MAHPLVTQLRFSRSEFVRCLKGVSVEDALCRVKPMNSLSWIVGHLASQEHFLWVQMAQGENIAPGLQELVGFGRPPTTPPWEEMWTLWRDITEVADRFLDDLTAEMLYTHLEWKDKPITENIGSTLLRNIFHYWFHLGEAHAIRQQLGHSDLPQFVGDLSEVRFDSK
ncbi:MAG TPA: DinB family protein [Anaerolineae bacterium]|nr:DinB family protein [Anaerolineae bacterium]